MEWITALKDWASENSSVLWWLGATSLVLLLLTPIAVTWLVVRLPTDYFVNERHRRLAAGDHAAFRSALLILKNLLGLLLVVAGLIMLVVPGQGLLTIVVGILLLDFPGKSRLERWLVTRRHIWRSINWLRRRMKKPELQRPADN
jgi:hypothetical protein